MAFAATAAPHAGDLPTTQKTHAALPLLADTTLAAGAAVALVASTAHLPLLAACQAEARLAGGAQAAHVAVAARRIGRAALLAQALPAGHLEVGRAGARGSSVRLGAALLVKATAGAAIHRGQGCGGGSTKAVGAARVARQALGILAAHLAQRAALQQLGAGAAVASHTRAEEPHLLSWQQAWPSWPHATHVLLVLAQVRVKEGLPDSHLVSLQQGAPSMPQSTQVPAEHMRVSSLHALPPDLQQAWSLAPQAGGATGHFALLHFWPSAHWVLPWQQAWPGAPHATHCLFLQMNPDAPQSEVFLQLCRSSRA
eukprot:CAMPEP_0202858872 /NCGR_PEP_ID=MMETSP1391-20130828/1218_1 /ASSEMBLY_ACC=CAM_ASM_000867 /TAXON_ID=1034604 /ORGANISM="Chlamydomonas leiostraca, Strain SAG 11-49" /LENGTH=311 /DNA_ID=CAMNT_0049537839 /DNA_START=373 /DNA_END=1310 /DNA_ORIENTATION=+